MKRKILLVLALCALLTACAPGGKTELPPYEVKYTPVVVLPEYRVKFLPLLRLEYRMKEFSSWPIYEKVATTLPLTKVKPPELHYKPQPETELQRAYLEQLEACRRMNRESAKDRQPYIYYSLYDIDEDGTPELIVVNGDYGMGRFADVFTCRDGEAVFLGDSYCGNGSLNTWPGKNAMLYTYGQMGLFIATEIYIENGALERREIFRGEFASTLEYPALEDFAPGSQNLTWHQIGLDLPVMEYGAERSAVPLQYDEEVRARLTSTVRENGNVYGVDGGMWAMVDEDADTGLVPFDKYCFLCGDYMRGPLSFTGALWADVNGDGREEYVLWNGYDVCLVLGLQGDVVYAYYIYAGNDRLTVYSDGTFLHEWDYDWFDEPYTHYQAFRLSFDRDECYTAEQFEGENARSFADSSAVPLEWQAFELPEQ